MVENPHQRVHRVYALHGLKHALVKKILAEQGGRGATGTWGALQSKPGFVHLPRHDRTIHRNTMVTVFERLRAQTFVGPNQRQALGRQVEAQIQFRVMEAVFTQPNHGTDPHSTELIRF